MKHEAMMSMSLGQLDQYGKVCGIDVTGMRSREEKVAAIEERRARTADIDVLGMTLSVPVRTLHDKRVVDMVNSPDELSEDEADRLMTMLLGEQQYESLVGHCTDDDGVVDVEAIALALHVILNSDDLKNY